MSGYDEVMKESITGFHKVDGQDLSGPFSPFTLALQNIRNKLLIRRDGGNIKLTDADLDAEYLEHIISLSIPLANSDRIAEACIQFPVAACWRKDEKSPQIRYAGQFGSSREELEFISKTIEEYISVHKNGSIVNLEHVRLGDIIRRSSFPETRYPQNLRQISGFFHTKQFDGAEFYVFLSCQPIDSSKRCPLSKPDAIEALCNGAQIQYCCKNVVSLFQQYFLATHFRDVLNRISCNIRDSYRMISRREDPKLPDYSATMAYPILRETLSSIQENAVKLIPLLISNTNKQESFEEQGRKVFSVVFVMPSFTKEQQLCFRYILTHEQIQFLQKIDAKYLNQAITRQEKEGFISLVEKINEHDFIKLGKPQSFHDIALVLANSIIINDDAEVEPNEQNFIVEEFLREAIFFDYTFGESSKAVVFDELKKYGLATYIHSEAAAIQYSKTFLVDEVLKNRRPELMMNMINHPFSKLVQFPTINLLNAFKSNYTTDIFYPAGLNLLESLFLRSPLFLNPIYQYDVPLIFCAFDANFYSGHWQTLKGIIESHKDGIFSEIIGHEQNESKKFYEISESIKTLNPAEAANDFAKSLNFLTLRFCPDLDLINESSFRASVKDDDRTENREIRLPSNKCEGRIRLPDLGRQVILNKRIVNLSNTAKRHWKHYINMYLDDFYGSWDSAKSAEDKRNKITLHATKAAIAAIMGRNMSHNIGSHVLSHLSDSDADSQSPKFYKYLQGRSDFIAEISTIRPSWSMRMRLITDVIDPFVYSSKAYYIHGKEYLSYGTGELLNNIGRSLYDNETRVALDASKIEFIVRTKLHRYEKDFIYRFSKEDGFNGFRRKPVDAKGHFRDVNLDIPHGIVGCHALYSILENFVRNSIKHNGQKIIDEILREEACLKIFVEISETKSNPEALLVRIYDNVSDYSKKSKRRIAGFINGKEQGLVNEEGILNKNGGWGVKEMRISAAWLRNVPPESIQFETQAMPILSVGQLKDENGKNRLCYKIYLLKPLEVLIVDPSTSIKSDNNRGIHRIPGVKELREVVEAGGMRYKFIICNDNATSEWLKKNPTRVPERVLIVSDTGATGKLACISKKHYRNLLSDYETIANGLYDTWLKHLFGDAANTPIYCVGESSNDTTNKVKFVENWPRDGSKQILFEHYPMDGQPVDWLYWEPYSTSAGAGIAASKIKTLKESQSEATKLSCIYELIETALTRIVIADERLYSKLSNSIHYGPAGKCEDRVAELLKKWNMEVITLKKSKENGELLVYRTGETNPLGWCQYASSQKITFFSIHQTIITQTIGEKLFLDQIGPTPTINTITIHSGRGQVDITEGFKFIEFSNIETFVADNPDKHLLVGQLMSLSLVSEEKK